LWGEIAGPYRENFSHFWTIRNGSVLEPGANFLRSFVPAVTAASGAFAVFVAFGLCRKLVRCFLRSVEHIGFHCGGSIRTRSADVALSMAFGTISVIHAVLPCESGYLCPLPLVQIQTAPDDRVASAALNAIFGPTGAMIMASPSSSLHLAATMD